MILESIVTTVDSHGLVNIAPMGPVVQFADQPTDPDAFVLRPFESSQTLANLRAHPFAVIHVTDDAGLFARAAVGSVSADELVVAVDLPGSTASVASMGLPDTAITWWRLRDCHRWFAVEVGTIEGEGPRFELPCRIRHHAMVRPFFGFNRARHAVIEAAILATRTHLLAAEEIREQLDRLKPLIHKTAGEAEREGFALLCRVIDERLGT